MNEYTFQRIEERPINYVYVCIVTEDECSVEKGEYSLSITGITGALDISSIGGVDDVSLIKECIESHISEMKLPNDGTTVVVLKESGEWEDVFWHKYYVVERVAMVHSND